MPAFSALFLNDVTINQTWKMTIVPNPAPAGKSPGDIQIDPVSGPPSPTQLLTTSPDGNTWAIQINNGALQTVTAVACIYSFADIRTELSLRLNDPQKIFWPDAELKVCIWNALRFWNVLTGDNKVRYQLQTTAGKVWYDLSLAGPRAANLNDTDVYSWLQYLMLEAQKPNAAISSGQYTADDIVGAVQRKRDEFLFRSGCTMTVETLGVTPNQAALSLPNTVIQTLRAYWLPALGSAYPLIKADDWVTTAYVMDMTPETPDTFSAGMEVQGQLLLAPPASAAGNVECLCVESQGELAPLFPTLLNIPPDFVPGIMWGALADLMDSSMEKTDKPRADYARMRFEQFADLMKSYPFVFSAKVNGQLTYVDAVEVLDLYEPTWRTATANPSVVGLSGQNLVAFPSSTAMNIELFMLGSAPLPSNDGDCILLGREVIDVILDYAQHVASFKMVGQEFSSTMSLFQSIVKLAAKRNAKILAMASFKEVLYGREDREDEYTPKEKVSG